MDSTEILIKNCASDGVGRDRFGAEYLISSETLMIENVAENSFWKFVFHMWEKNN